MRVFFKNGSVINEISKEVNRYKVGSYSLSFGTDDYLYIASDFPLNHFYLKLGDVVNLESSQLTIDYWSDGWEEVVNLDDETNGFAQSGFVTFTPNREELWEREDSFSNGQSVDGLESIVVYDKYWIRIKADVAMTNSIDVEYVGHVFSDDNDLYAEFPIFNDSNFLTGFEAGKTTWQEQHVKASDLIIQDMKRKNIILGAEQILERSILMPACVCKTAEIIFNAFGNDYNDQLQRARNEYDKRMDLSKFVVDLNNDAIVSPVEKSIVQGWLSR